MKKYYIFSLITASLISSAAMADRDDLREQLDLKGARAAVQAIVKGEYNVDWSKFDFKNSEDDQRATKVHDYLDAVLGSKSTKWHEKSANIRRETGDYQHPLCLQYSARGAKYSTMQSTLSDSWSRAFSETLGPQDEVAEDASSSSMGTSSEIRLEDLDEKSTKEALWAVTHKFAVTEPADRESTSKVNQYLSAVLERKQQTSPKRKDYSTQWRNLGRSES